MIQRRTYSSLYLMSFTTVVLVMVLFILSCKKDKDPEGGQMPFKVESYYPNSGNEGTLVTILGTGFDTKPENVSITFSGQPAEVIALHEDKLIVRAPKGTASGMIRMKSGSNQSDVGSYKYQQLSLREIFPTNGSSGSHIRIMGEGFSSVSSPAAVLINGKDAVVVSVSDTVLVVEVPENAGTGPVQVKVNGFESTGPVFHYQTITAIKPLTGGRGTRVTITGSGFAAEIAGNTVDFNGKPATIVSAKEDEIVVIAPNEVETGPVSLTINKQRTTGPDFTVVPLPTIEFVSPLSGPGGIEMVIRGLTFSPNKEENKVLINGVVVPVTSATDKELKLIVPGNTGTGEIRLSVNDQEVTGPKFFDQSLGIKGITPDNGLSGTEVTLTGTGFSSNPSENIVTFNNVAATVLSASETKITVKAPANLLTGTLKIKVGNLEAAAPKPFRRAGVITLVGGPGNANIDLSTNGSIAVDASGNVFAIENTKNRVLKISPAGQVSVFAGSSGGQAGLQNGTGTEARFRFDNFASLTIDKNQNLYVADYGNQVIRKINPQGLVSTFMTGVGNVFAMTTDASGNIYAMRGTQNAMRMTPQGELSSLNVSSKNYYHRPAFDSEGNLYLSPDDFELYISKYPYRAGGTVPQPPVKYWAGNPVESGYSDGIGREVKFTWLRGMQISDQQLFILDSDNAFNIYIRQANLQTGAVSTAVKSSRGYQDGNLDVAQFLSLYDLAIDKEGVIYVLDNGNNAIRKVYLK